MALPRFSIVIPTRERAQTLYFTLRTCIMQKYEDFEIIVCDNFSSIETKQVVESFRSRKIKYVRSDTLLAMSDNWELALSQAVGEFVIVIGDDDGLLPNALVDLDLFINKTHAKAIRWAVVTYLWPNVEGGLAANKIHIPIPHQTFRINSHQAIKSVISGRKDYSILPMLYYSAIHKDLITELKRRIGRVFNGSNPDIFTAFALAYIAELHFLIGKPLSIVGYSGKSTGVAGLFSGGNDLITKEFVDLDGLAGFFIYKQVPNIPSISAAVASEFLHVKEALFPQDDQFLLDRKQFVINYVNDLESFNWVGKKEWDVFIRVIKDSLSDDFDLQRWFHETYIENYNPKGKPWVFSQDAWQDGLTTASLYLDGKGLGVSDVFGAAELCGKFITNSIKFIEVTDQVELPISPKSDLDLRGNVFNRTPPRNIFDKDQGGSTSSPLSRFWLVESPSLTFRLFQLVAKVKKKFLSL